MAVPVSFVEGRALVRPFTIPEQIKRSGQPPYFVTHDQTEILHKHFERATAFDIEHLTLEERMRAWAAQLRCTRYEHFGRATDISYFGRER